MTFIEHRTQAEIKNEYKNHIRCMVKYGMYQCSMSGGNVFSRVRKLLDNIDINDDYINTLISEYSSCPDKLMNFHKVKKRKRKPGPKKTKKCKVIEKSIKIKKTKSRIKILRYEGSDNLKWLKYSLYEY